MKMCMTVLGIILVLLGLIFLIPGFYFDMLGVRMQGAVVAIILVIVGALITYYSRKKK